MKAVIVFAALLSVACATTFRKSDLRVVGGKDAAEGQFPYQISLRIYDSHTCGGSILNQNWIITAAHCVVGNENQPSIYSVVAGTTRLDAGGSSYQVAEILIHEDFSMTHIHNDIALLRVGSPVQLNEKVQTIALNEEDFGADEDVVLSGWGRIYAGGPLPNILQYINLKSVSWQDCDSSNSNAQWNVDATQTCTYTKVGEGICNGDSGGPLVYKGKLAGLASWVFPCAIGYPDVYTRVSSYVNWVNARVN